MYSLHIGLTDMHNTVSFFVVLDRYLLGREVNALKSQNHFGKVYSRELRIRAHLIYMREVIGSQ